MPHQTHYRSYRGRVFTDQMTWQTVSKHSRLCRWLELLLRQPTLWYRVLCVGNKMLRHLCVGLDNASIILCWNVACCGCQCWKGGRTVWGNHPTSSTLTSKTTTRRRRLVLLWSVIFVPWWVLVACSASFSYGQLSNCIVLFITLSFRVISSRNSS